MIVLREAASRMDATAASSLPDAGLEMDEATTAAAFRVTADAVDRAQAEDRPLPADVPRMPHLVSDADLRHLSERSKVTTKTSSAEDISSCPWKIVASLLFTISLTRTRTDPSRVLQSVPPTALMAPTLRAYDIVAVPNETTSIIIIDD